MIHQPGATQLLQAVAEFLRGEAATQLGGRTAYNARVAANLLDIVRREIELGPCADANRLAGLRQLLGTEGTLDDLHRQLCEGIASGALHAGTPGLAERLWRDTLDALAVDQPSYAIVPSPRGPAPTED